MPNTEPYSKPTKRATKATPGRPSAPSKKVPARRMSSEELSRHEREVRATRMILTGMGALVVLVAAILGFGWWREYVAKSSESVATVAGNPITLEQYAGRLDLGVKSTEQQLTSMQMQLQTLSGSAGDSIANLYRQQIQQLQFNLILLPDQTLDQMIQDELIRQEAARRGLTVSAEEIDQETKKNFGDQPTPVPQPSPTEAPVAAGQPTSTPAPTATLAPTPTEGPTPSPVPTADVQARLSSVLTGYGLSMADYRATVEVQLLRQKLQDAMGAEVPTTEEQVHARHILVDTEDKAKEIVDKLKAGAGFEDLAKAESTDSSNKDKGGDLGWFGHGQMAPEFDDAAFKLEVGQYSDPVKTQYGYHIIQVMEKDPNRKLDDQQLAASKNAAITTWLDKTSSGPDVKRTLTEDQKKWVYKRVKWSPPSTGSLSGGG